MYWKRGIILEKFLVRNFSAIQQAAGAEELDNVFWLPVPSGRIDENEERRGGSSQFFGIRNVKSQRATSRKRRGSQ